MGTNRSIGIWIISLIAIAFGLLTLKSGGEVLFIDGAAREAAGNFIPYVLWSNFILGFLYIVAGIGLWLQKRWAVWLALSILAITLTVFATFGMHIIQGGLFEQRTVGAMILRSVVWLIISIIAYRRVVTR